MEFGHWQWKNEGRQHALVKSEGSAAIFIALQVLPDDPGDQPDRHIALFVYVRNHKGYLILFPHSAGIIAGMGVV